jgi:glycerol uptake operon antiterminator
MAQKSICEILFKDSVIIPSVRNVDDFKFALGHTKSASIILLFGDIIVLPSIIQEAKKYNKRVLVHLDLIGGIGKDRSGIRYLARLGVNSAITTKPQLVKFAREEGMIVIQRLFVMDSEALKSGINLLKSCNPDAVEVMPASIPKIIIEQLVKEIGLPVLAGGLMHTLEDIETALKNGAQAVSTSKKELWE